MSRKNISDLQVCQAYVEMKRLMNEWSANGHRGTFKRADEILAERTGEHPKVCWAAMERANGNGLLDYGINLRGGWLTAAGEKLIADSKP